MLTRVTYRIINTGTARTIALRSFQSKPTQVNLPLSPAAAAPQGTNKLQTRSFESNEPGSLAFCASETEAIIDLFNHHVRKYGGTDVDGPYLCEQGVQKLLKGIGERADNDTVRCIFEHGDRNFDGKLHLLEFLQVADKVLGSNPARFVFVVGGPGSGKGLLCARLQRECGVSHISSGDLLRGEIARGTPLGMEVDEIIKTGGLVPSDIITALLRRRMKSFPGQRVLLDGFPRSTQNAIDFAATCGKPEMALLLDCDDTVMMERVIKRGAAADAAAAAAVNGAVNGQRRRGDDNIETALQRIRNYHKFQRPVMDWLRDEHIPIVHLDASGSPENVWEQLMAIGRLMRPTSKIPFQS